ncbi:MAG: hypothetical protein H7240_05215, partial [Glaciimonas sp.]|nr:hypothetical protein [Glaciimonas sp.]
DKVLHHSLILLSFAAYLFIAFKGGFLRHDGHAQIAGIAIVISTFLLAFSFRSTHTPLLITLSICTWGYIDNNYTKTSTDQLVSRISSTYISAWRGAKNRLIDNDGLKIKFNEELKSLNAQKNFPVLNGTTDIYSYDQALLIASGNTWNPRPIFQSYSVYTPELAEINKKHLLSDKAPNNIFFKIEPIDNRLPALEDGASWPTLLTEYSLTTQSNGYLYLRHKENHLQPNEETFVRSGTYSFGDFVPVPSGDSPIFAELTVTSSLIGRLIGILYKPAQLQIELQLKNGKTTTYRLISGMAKSGFIVNPLIESTDEFGLLYGGLNYLNNKSVKSFTISQINSTHQWNNTYEVTFKKIKSNQQGDISKIFEFNKFTENSLKDNISLVKRCDGTIDTLNGTSPLIKSTVNKLIRARGWLAKSAENGAVGDSIFLVLRDSTGKFKLISTKKVMRPDVGAHFKNSALDSSGFESIAIMEAASGDYTLGLAYTEGDKVMVCTQFNFPIHVDN